MAILLLFVCVLALVLINVPIAVALGIVAVSALVATQGLASLPNLPIVLYNGATNFPLLAIPLFILAGSIMNDAVAHPDPSAPSPIAVLDNARHAAGKGIIEAGG